jgi:hypothetical protein
MVSVTAQVNAAMKLDPTHLNGRLKSIRQLGRVASTMPLGSNVFDNAKNKK